ncbi:16118_t:CDS:2 [Cetraspora pellucida]|uniref:16118_t:CDS:1 n=1 Tax=Cetraspora pellucida TaxID=1433469 RepID=A0A9N8WFG8_9GLOM|nr:16118_t:CDS:2 [Cetraspora pellucida]
MQINCKEQDKRKRKRLLNSNYGSAQSIQGTRCIYSRFDMQGTVNIKDF